jgi:signal transduction histidine kinase
MDDSVSLDVRDDGAGFNPIQTIQAGSFGLAAMRQRVEHVNGVMHIESATGEGTAISVRIPAALIGSHND